MNTVSALLYAAQDTYGLSRDLARTLTLAALGRPTSDTAWLLSHGEDTLPPAQAAAALPRFSELCKRLQSGEPLAYVLGCVEFYGLQLSVSPAVLIPRPDTETLVDWALEKLHGLSAAGVHTPSVLDLGTGSGAVACAIKAYAPSAHVTASDASHVALGVATRNAAQLKLPIDFLHSDWFTALAAAHNPVAATARKFNLIVSNPPYIAEGDAHLPALRHEPLQALTSGADGLNDVRHIVHNAPTYLAPQGWLLLEHGYDQSEAVQQLMAVRGFTEVQTRKDLGGNPRCTGGQWVTA